MDGLNIEFSCLAAETKPIEFPHDVPQRSLPHALILQIRGARYLVERERQQTAAARPGEALVVPPGMRFALRMAGARRAVSVYSHVNFTLRSGIDLFSLIRLPLVLDSNAGEKIGALNAVLAAVCSPSVVKINETRSPFQEDLRRQARTQALGFELLAILADYAESPTNALRSEGLERMLPVLQYLHEHLAEPVTRTRLAKLAHLSETRFHFVFKAATGMAPMEYVQQQRLTRAKRLLHERSLSIHAIAATAGFADPLYFSRLFRAREGVTPSYYRKLAQTTAH